jgi:hypothetical protein
MTLQRQLRRQIKKKEHPLYCVYENKCIMIWDADNGGRKVLERVERKL